METLYNWWHTLQAGPSSDWINDIFLLTGFSLLCWFVWKVLISRLHAIAGKTKVSWDNSLVHAISAPMSVLIWLWPASISIKILLTNLANFPVVWITTFQQILLIIAFIWVTIRLTIHVENQLLLNSNRDETTVHAIAKISRLVFITIGILSVMQTVGLSLSGLLTFGGVGGLIVGLAAKDLLSNFFGGLMIYFDRPFKVGDWIRSPDRSIEGTVERIGWRMTIIRTFDKRPLYIPNSVFSNIVVENPSRMSHRRINETIGIRYEDASVINDIIADVKVMLSSHSDLDATQTLIVNFDKFGPSSLNFFIYTFTKTVDWVTFHEVKQDVLLNVLAIVHKHNADVAFPTQTLKIEPPDTTI
ncbi:mechanosensitive ion channel family protein [Aliivibrio kagoshimensis]|uniref:mechanosensitive ion channel family protein n=1 Tax=Aliivibrio kagoshimensis TaxID=2910230 RepID=UPI003D0D770B